jgi:hypothetical protein
VAGEDGVWAVYSFAIVGVGVRTARGCNLVHLHANAEQVVASEAHSRRLRIHPLQKEGEKVERRRDDDGQYRPLMAFCCSLKDLRHAFSRLLNNCQSIV